MAEIKGKKATISPASEKPKTKDTAASTKATPSTTTDPKKEAETKKTDTTASTGKPMVMDALEILGLSSKKGGADDEKDSLDDEVEVNAEGEEVFACNNVGNEEDRSFDAIIGALEGVMVSENFQKILTTHLEKAGEYESITNEHERFLVYKKYLEEAEAFVDAEVAAAVPDVPEHKLAEIVKTRQQEVSEDVLEVLSGECVSWQSFETLWKEKGKKKKEVLDEKKWVNNRWKGKETAKKKKKIVDTYILFFSPPLCISHPFCEALFRQSLLVGVVEEK